MNQNWIVENLNNAFSTWNGKLTELWGLVTTSPQSFKGGAVWGVMQSLHSAMVGIPTQIIMVPPVCLFDAGSTGHFTLVTLFYINRLAVSN